MDSEAMVAALDAGGTAVGMLADSLSKHAVSGRYRRALMDGRLVLLSAVDPDSGFNTGNAMARNKYIYGLATWGLVVSASPSARAARGPVRPRNWRCAGCLRSCV